MNKYLFPAGLCLLLCLIFACNNHPQPEPEAPAEENGPYPADWFFRQRAYPQGTINKDLYLEALKTRQSIDLSLESRDQTWTTRGPINVGGRITDIAVHPSDINTIYAGAASGGIFKTANRGESWVPIFDDALSLAIGDMDVAPSNANILYVGTGEANAGGGSLAYDGAGVFKTTNGGQSWTHLGLENVGSIGKVEIHPENPDIAYVAAMGHLFADNPDRGVYRTEDGGAIWEKVLYQTDSTGAVDLVIHPNNPSIIYAAMWERVRRPDRRNYGGPTSGIYRSVDGGDNWEKLTQGLPNIDMGRIGIDIFAADPDILYAMVSDHIGNLNGVYKTTNGGDNWTSLPLGGFQAPSYMWWFGKVFIDPIDSDVVYVSSLDVMRTTNSGGYWGTAFPGVHVDQHAMYIHPADPEFIIIGNDGGIYISENGGGNWEHIDNLPISQFYTCEIDPSDPNRLYGGTQDNGTIRTLTGNDNDWDRILGGDGFVCLVDPDNPNVIFAEFQYGGLRKSTNGGITFGGAGTGFIPGEPRNWNSPLVFNPHNSRSLYFGTNRLYKTTDQAVTWEPVSPTLAEAPAGSNLVYGTLTTISVSPVDTNIIYAGTDDGSVFSTNNGGDSWNLVSSSLPTRWVTSVTAHPFEADVAYVTFSGYRYNEYLPHVFKTTNQGSSWTDISFDLPEVPVNDLVVDPHIPDRLFVATDAGVYASYNGGENWEPFGHDLPSVPVNDLCLHADSGTLAAATYGRSMFTASLGAVNVEPEPGTLRRARLFPNPIVETGTLLLELNTGTDVQIRIFDQSGKLIRSLHRGRLGKGAHQFSVNLPGAPTGTYVVSIIADGQVESLVFQKVD